MVTAGRKQTNWLFTNVAEELNVGLQRTTRASGQNGTEDKKKNDKTKIKLDLVFVMTCSTYLTIIRRRRSESRRIFPETKSRGIFAVIHWAWGEKLF